MKAPSKELLTEVLGYLVTNVSLVRNNRINITGDTEKYTPATVSFNIYELAHECKVWAWKKHRVTIKSGYSEHGEWSNLAHTNVSFCSMDIPLTEPEAVFKAGEWVLKETK